MLSWVTTATIALAGGERQLDLVVDGAGGEALTVPRSWLRALVFMRMLLVGRRAVGDGAAVVDADDIVGESRDVRFVVGDEEDRQAEARLQLAQLVAQADAQRRVERGEGLVEEQRARLGGQGARQRGRAGAGRRRARRGSGRRARRISSVSSQRSTAAAPRAGADCASPRLRPKDDVLAHREVGEQGVLLEQVAAAGARRPAGRCPARRIEQRLAVQGDGALVGSEQPGDRLQRQALAGAGRAEQHQPRRRRCGTRCRASKRCPPLSSVLRIETSQRRCRS